MKLSLYSSVARTHPFGLHQVIRWATRFGYEQIDIRGSSLYSFAVSDNSQKTLGYDMINPSRLSAAAREDLTAALIDRGVGISSISSYVPLTVSDARLQEQAVAMLKAYVDLAVDLQCPAIRTYGNDVKSPDEYDEAFANHVVLLREIAAYAATRDVVLLIETNENTVTPNLGAAFNVHAQVGAPNLKVVLDAVNVYFGGTPLVELDAEVDKIDARVAMLHVKNVQMTAGAPVAYHGSTGQAFVWTDLATGDLDWKHLLTRARARGFDGPVVYEYANPFKGMSEQFWDRIPPPDKAAQAAAEFLRGAIA
ncbi:MAG: sugar phosphate isomerase/epimerase [Thermaerobacter sp.]|nr:sugar phosphate isomerase/epimerase [Thermaerobacter sp.]